MVAHLFLTAELSNVTGLIPVDTVDQPFEYTFKIQCTACRETHPKQISINLYEKHEIQGSRGEANFIFKCGFCGKHSNVELSKPKKFEAYNISDSTKKVAILDMEARGLDLVEFIPVGLFQCSGCDEEGNLSGTKFKDVDLSDNEWYDYDDDAAREVSITETKWEILKK
ncbi:hypothetical protein CANARDRAFT_193326 [[Candida] arabinofermentans NRRL YB-2248]|uniref:DUF866-domain-containing protein n=1 Tax=[Candida] arabinofermentans NRRL YB-2248 TaxID=983967 RepID=A0A1E4T7U1_9ASCO|nr:hypothetical protein CANARDRAFT_193326 [[Candida] arabinofermentans NRRL YB-2248]